MTKPIMNKKGRAQTLHGLLDSDQTSQITHFYMDLLHRKKEHENKSGMSPMFRKPVRNEVSSAHCY